MAAGIYNMSVEQGATYQRTFTWYTSSDADQSACGCGNSATPVDLTGFTADMQIRQAVGAPTVLYEASTLNGAIVLGGATGTIALTIPASATSLFAWLKGVYDMNLTSPGGIVTRLLQGTVVVSPEVTR